MGKIKLLFLTLALIVLTLITALGQTSAVEVDEEVVKAAELEPNKTISVIILFDKKPIGYKNKIRAIGGEIIYDYTIITGLAIKIPGKALGRLKKLENLKAIYENERVYALLQDSTSMISADWVWEQNITGKDIKVCIVDTGVDYTHPALGGCFGPGCKVIGGYDFVNDDSDPIDDNGHGTHCAGIVSSDDPYARGVANGSLIYAVKVLDAEGRGYTDDVVAGIEWCVNNSADVISISLGSGLYLDVCDDRPTSIAVNNAADYGIPSSVAAGNSGECGISAPACASRAIAVGAVDKSGNVVGWSSKAKTLDLVAPGHSINSTVLNGRWAVYSGTSMAAPHVSGVIALMGEKNPSLTPLKIREIFNESSDPVNKCYESCVRRPGACLCWTDPYKEEVACSWEARAAGIVNASRAVEAASKFISITLIGYPVDFGALNPGTSDGPALGNPYIVRINPETTVNVDIYQRGDDYVSDAAILGIGNMSWYGTDDALSSHAVTKDYSLILADVAPGTDIELYYWIDIPTAHKAGDYNTTIYIKAVERET